MNGKYFLIFIITFFAVTTCTRDKQAVPDSVPAAGQTKKSELEESADTAGLDKWAAAEREIIRLPPSAFPQLPEDIVKWLEEKGYTIPQMPQALFPYEKQEPHNVISGEFAQPGQTDWAVLASKEGKSSIIVFWGGNENNNTELLEKEDRWYLLGYREDEIYYSRGILLIERDSLIKNYEPYDDYKVPLLDHDAIMNMLDYKPSLVYYYYKGKWLKFLWPEE